MAGAVPIYRCSRKRLPSSLRRFGGWADASTVLNKAMNTHTPKDLSQQLARAKRIAEDKGGRFTPLRAHIYTLVCEQEGAVKAYDLLDKLSPEHGSPKPPTVYRALEFLSKLGLVHRVEALNAFIACDHSHAGHLAEFFVCETCESVEERHAHDHSDCRPEGFQIRRSVVEHYGACQNCVSETATALQNA